ncbi:hypothetical protein FHG87_019894 [Trinorchestia longiramus]|nr:hypothetical protein FHG87_019894 [Trinorchestia longiramus]
MTWKNVGFHNKVRSVFNEGITFTHCMIHWEVLETKNNNEELCVVRQDSVNIINYIKTRALNTRLFTNLCKEMGSNCESLLLQTDIRWLLRGRALKRLISSKKLSHVVFICHSYLLSSYSLLLSPSSHLLATHCHLPLLPLTCHSLPSPPAAHCHLSPSHSPTTHCLLPLATHYKPPPSHSLPPSPQPLTCHSLSPPLAATHCHPPLPPLTATFPQPLSPHSPATQPPLTSHLLPATHRHSLPPGSWPLRLWTHDLTQRLLQKVQQRKRLLLDPKLRRRMVHAEVSREFQLGRRPNKSQRPSRSKPQTETETETSKTKVKGGAKIVLYSSLVDYHQLGRLSPAWSTITSLIDITRLVNYHQLGQLSPAWSTYHQLGRLSPAWSTITSLVDYHQLGRLSPAWSTITSMVDITNLVDW